MIESDQERMVQYLKSQQAKRGALPKLSLEKLLEVLETALQFDYSVTQHLMELQQQYDGDDPNDMAVMEMLLKAKSQDEKFFAIGVEDEDVEEALAYYREQEPKV